MNAVEIEEAVSQIASEPFDAAEFPFSFLKAFGNKDATIARLRSGVSNSSDIPGGVLQRNNIHLAACATGGTHKALTALRLSNKTAQQKARFIVTTDGQDFEAEDLTTGESVACTFATFPDHFGFFLPLAGISTVQQIRESAFDIRATGRLNKLYLQLRKDNPDWDTPERQHDMNHFMARLIFCFFAEDTSIFFGDGLFTRTVERMSAPDASNTHHVIETIFRALNMSTAERNSSPLPRWAEPFPYVNGGLFGGKTETPRFTKIARSYLLHIGSLDWKQINPDIFGSMIQAVADDEERGALGMHYTSVPNILKCLNPLLLDELREKLQAAGDNSRSLLNLRRRLSHIRVFDPACGSGNFLVIAYKELRAIEAEINQRRGEAGRKTEIPITNFRGIEVRDFPAEIARLALIIAEFQCDTLYRGQQEALQEFLPLDSENWITCGNALRVDWLNICPPTGTKVKVQEDDLLSAMSDLTSVDFQNEGGETFICGNPPYSGLSSQTAEQKHDLQKLFEHQNKYWKSFDYVMGWFWKAHNYMQKVPSKIAFVSTNSICQGQLVPMFWPMVLDGSVEIFFAYTSFKWSNLASNNAGVTVVIVGLSNIGTRAKKIFECSPDGRTTEKAVNTLNAYLVPSSDVYVEALSKPRDNRPTMIYGNKPTDGGNLILSSADAKALTQAHLSARKFLRPYFGSEDFINASPRVCIWVADAEVDKASQIPELQRRFNAVREFRANSNAKETRAAANVGHRFRQIQGSPGSSSIIIPRHSSESRDYLPIGLVPEGAIISDAAFAMYSSEFWSLSLLLSRLHLVWIASVCGKLETRYRYSNTLGWNTFPIPSLTDQNTTDLARCAEQILIARESHFPSTIADLYAPDCTPVNLRTAHDQNDETVERIYVGRRFRNDSERLERLFEMYEKSLKAPAGNPAGRNKKKKAS